MRSFYGVLVAVVMAASMSFAPAATAATEIGNNCAGTAPAPNYTVLPLAQAPGSALPITAPAAGVVTKWKVNSAFVLPPGYVFPQRVRVFRSTGPKQFQTVGESSLELMASGINTHETRIPIQAGDRVGAYSPIGGFVLLCPTTSEADVLGLKEGDVGFGGTAEYAEAKKLQLAMSAVIEPDIDADGFGDETQDKCVQSAALQVPCPPLLLDAVSLPPGKGSVRVLVAVDAGSSITVSASAKVPKGKKGKGKTVTRLLPIAQLVSPGAIFPYTLNFTKALKDALKVLPRKKSINLEVVAEGKNSVGATSTDRLTVKLKGQAKPKK